MGAQVIDSTSWTSRLGVLTLAAVCCAHVPVASADQRYALIVSGAAGGPEYAQKYQKWRMSLVRTLREKLEWPADHVHELSDEGEGPHKATRENVRRAVADLRKRAAEGDVTLVLLMGHGTADTEEAKFNLVGPDMGVDEWAALLKPIPGRLVFVNGASGSFPFLAKLAGARRVVLTSADSAAQQYETVFPQYFIEALNADGADLDKNGKVSILEAFTFASARVRNWFEQRGQLATERALLDDVGDGIGREADAPGRGGTLAQVTYLQPDVPLAFAGNPRLAALMRQRVEVENALNLLRSNKSAMPVAKYEAELERLLLELARLDRQLRSKT
jgi:hypothetical protein